MNNIADTHYSKLLAAYIERHLVVSENGKPTVCADMMYLNKLLNLEVLVKMAIEERERNFNETN